MNNLKIRSLVIIAIFSFFNGADIYCQKLSPLAIFDDFVNKGWTGHYMNSEDSNIVHQIKWERMLGSTVIKEIKCAPDVDFEMLTYFYWDNANNQIEFLSLDNKGNSGKGVVSVENNLLIYQGRYIYKNGESVFKKTFEINCKGILVDHFYLQRGGKWVQRHHIEYETGLK